MMEAFDILCILWMANLPFAAWFFGPARLVAAAGFEGRWAILGWACLGTMYVCLILRFVEKWGKGD